MNCKFRHAQATDLSAILAIIREAQMRLKEAKIDQWQDNYPNKDVLLNDILKKQLYLITVNQTIAGMVVLQFDVEVNYNSILNGKWHSNQPYATIHRLAIANEFITMGLAKQLISFVETMAITNQIFWMRSDTHPHNLTMQALLKRCGYKHCGSIFLNDGALRLAYDKELTQPFSKITV